jgi:C_GCAxxG_C_C family probable redox protein
VAGGQHQEHHMSKPDDAVALFAKRHNCAQAVLAAFGPEAGLAEPVCQRAAAAFGGGIGRMGETCGAVTGALMALGLRYGDYAPDNAPAKAALYARALELVARFKARNSTVLCRDLLGVDISTDAGFKQAQERRVHETVCPKFVRDAAEILETL